MRLTRALLAWVAACLCALSSISTAAGASSSECTEPPNDKFYAKVLLAVSKCADKVGFEVVANPLTDEQRLSLCHKCKSLATATASKRFGICTVKDQTSGVMMTLQAQMDQIFICQDVEASSGSGLGFDGIDSDDTTTNSTTNGSGSQSGLTAEVKAKKGSSIAIRTVVGIAIAGIALVVVVASLIICHRREKNKSGVLKLEQTVLAASTPHNTPSNTPVATGFTHIYNSDTAGGNSALQFSQLQLSLLLQSGGLWDDQVIVASRIPKEKIVSGPLISRGGFGEVYLGSYNAQVVAIKTLLPETKKNMKEIGAFLYEVKLLATLEHERIVRFVGVAWDSLTDLCVVSEYMEGGDLRSVLNRFEDVERRHHGFDYDKIKIALHIAHALTYLHSLQPIVLHRDLKSKNILLDAQMNAKLTDFGVSRERSDTTTMTAGVGTSLWMAPEVMLGERYDEKSDVYSFGVVLSELGSHALPYAQAKESGSGRRIPNTAILQLVSMGRLRVSFSPSASPEMVEFAHACLSLTPRERPTAADALYKLHELLKRMK